MKKLRTEEWIAVAAGIGFLTYLFFSGPLLNLFTPSTSTAMSTNANEPLNPESAAATAAESAPGVKATDLKVGSGEIAEPGDIVTAHYTGKLPDGTVFDSSKDRGQPISFILGAGQVIKGWDQGLQGMRVGGERTLVISPEYGYGNHAVGSIPANSTLIFDVELVNVQKGS
jgi:peptidylprolyl isomerase